MAKLGKNEDVREEVLVKICRTLHCTLDDIVEILPEKSKESRVMENNLTKFKRNENISI